MISTKKTPSYLKLNYIKFNTTVLLLCLCAYSLIGQQTPDSIKNKKTPKHYFLPTFYLDYYSTGKVQLEKDIHKIESFYWNNKLKSYQFSQTSGGGIVPVFTKDFNKGDSVAPANIHLLATGSFLLAKPGFAGINDHTFFKGSIGMRGIYNTGAKSIWFVDCSIWTAQDITYNINI